MALLLLWPRATRDGWTVFSARPPPAPPSAAARASPAPSTPGSKAAPLAGTTPTPTEGFTALEPGLDLGLYSGPPGAAGDPRIWVVRIDPARFELRLLSAAATDSRPRTLRDWASGVGASAGINAGMFRTDGLTALGLMRTREHENNGRLSQRMKSVLAFDPEEPGLPAVALLDTACGEAPPLPPYGSFLQSIRMISCERQNVWAPEGRRASTAAIGLDGEGRVLFVHARSPASVHDLTDTLLGLPIDLRRAMYLEGGPEAQLYVRGGGDELERRGAFEGSKGDERGGLAWELPNVLVAVRRAR